MAHCEELEALTDEIKREQERASDLSIELERERCASDMWRPAEPLQSVTVQDYR